jgi:hypothetical protein
MKKVFFALIAVGLFALSSCSSGSSLKTAWDHYDACSTENQSLKEIVKCGKLRRTEYCKTATNCGSDGDATVLYADTLVQAVERKEMTETQAKLKWVEFRNSKSGEYARFQQAEDARAAAALSSMNAVNAMNRPRSCFTTGGVTNCY